MTKYSPVISEDLPSKTKSFKSGSIRTFIPSLLHLIMLAMVNIFILYIDNHQFALSRGRVEVMEANGTVTRFSSFRVAQSDITTLVSFLSSVARVIGTLWAGEIAWRCVLLFLEGGGMPLSGIQHVLGGGLLPPARGNFKTFSHFTLFLAIFVAVFSSDYLSSILTGSVTWYGSFTLMPGTQPVRNIPRAVPGDSFGNYSSLSDMMDLVILSASASATVAWGLRANDTSMKLVLKTAGFLTVDSRLHNVTVPYFAVDKFEWINPNTLSEQQKAAVLAGYRPRGPYFASSGRIGLLPASNWTLLNDSIIPNPHTVTETRILSIRTRRSAVFQGACDNDDASIPAGTGRLTIPVPSSSSWDCFAFAQISYRAGAAKCENCTISAPTVIDSKSAGQLQLLPDAMTRAAVAHASLTSTYLLFSYYAVPSGPAFSDAEKRSVELLSRSYQAAWISLTEAFGSQKDSTDVTIAFKTSRAVIAKWKVLLWNILHGLVFGLGMSVVIRQYWSDHSWAVENPPFAALMLDTTELRGDEPWQAATDLNAWSGGQQPLITLDTTAWRIKLN